MKRALLALGLLCLTTAGPARAGIGVHLAEPVLRVARGASLTVPVRLVNASDQFVYLSGGGHDLPASLAPSTALAGFFATRPDSLSPGQAWEGVLLDLEIAPDAPIGSEIYRVTLLGGPGHENNDVIGEALVMVDVYDATCAPVIVTQPGSLVTASGSNAALTIAVDHADGATYQWRKEGLPIFDDAHVSGSQTATLNFQNVVDADSGAYDVRIVSECGAVTSTAVMLRVNASTVDAPPVVLRPVLFLAPPRPNPAHSSVLLSWSLPVAGPVRLEILDVAGRQIRTLVHGPREAGVGQAIWDGAGSSGGRVSAGVYFVRLIANRETRVQKLVLLR